MSTATLCGILSLNYWQSQHPYLRMYRNLITIVAVLIIIAISITVAVSQLCHVAWQYQTNQHQDTVQFGCVNIILCFLAHLANTFFSVINLCPPYGACS